MLTDEEVKLLESEVCSLMSFQKGTGFKIDLLSLIADWRMMKEALERIMRVGTTSEGNTQECEIAYKALGGSDDK